MNINSVSCNIPKTTFGHGHSDGENNYSFKEKAIVATTTALGVGASLAVLAKHSGYSLNPSKMLNLKNFKQSYFYNAEFKAPQIIGMGVGTCLGGLTGGYLIDKNPANRKSKQREAIMQIGNISIPILTVDAFYKLTSKCNKGIQCLGTVAGIFVGVYLANFLMNKFSNILFHNKDERGVKIVDFSAHLDDVMAGAGYISENMKSNTKASRFIKDGIHWISRAIPVALMFPGFEVGTKQAGTNKK